MAKPVILLTACINPNGMANTALQDAEVRKTQYLDAIDFYLKATKCNIVLCENTGTDLFDEVSSPEKYTRLESLVFCGNDYNKSRGIFCDVYKIRKERVTTFIWFYCLVKRKWNFLTNG